MNHGKIYLQKIRNTIRYFLSIYKKWTLINLYKNKKLRITEKTNPQKMEQYNILTHRLREFPSRSDMDYSLNDAITVVMDEGKRSRFIGYGQGELVVIY